MQPTEIFRGLSRCKWIQSFSRYQCMSRTIMCHRGVSSEVNWMIGHYQEYRQVSKLFSTQSRNFFNSSIYQQEFLIAENDIREAFVRGSGPGGQKINKTKNAVQLVHEPTGISVLCQQTRDLTSNRKIARKVLKDKIDLAMNGVESKLGRKHQKLKKKKQNAARRAAKKYHGGDNLDNEVDETCIPAGAGAYSDTPSATAVVTVDEEVTS